MTNATLFTENPTKGYPSPAELVTEFHTVYGQPIRITPVLDVPERGMRVALIEEERDEYIEAETNDDIIEIFDALGDEVYVAQGAAITHGINLTDYTTDLLFAHDIDPTVKKYYQVYLDGLGVAPHLANDHRQWAQEIMRAAVQKYVAAENSDDLTAMGQALANIIVTCYAVAAAYGVNLDVILQEIQRSNMSKLGEDGKPIYYLDGPKKGKVIKGPNFSEPDLTKILFPENL